MASEQIYSDQFCKSATGLRRFPSHRKARFTRQQGPTAAQKPFGLEHRLLQLRLRQQLFEQGVLLLRLGQTPGLLGLHAAVLLPPSVVGRLRHLKDAADVGDGLALGDQLLGF